MNVLSTVAALAAIFMLCGCGDAILREAPVAALPPQPAPTGGEAAPTAVVIVLPPEIYKTIPSQTADSHMATEAQLGLIEDYALHLDSADRDLLEAHVNDCRFTAHDSCTVQPETPAAKS